MLTDLLKHNEIGGYDEIKYILLNLSQSHDISMSFLKRHYSSTKYFSSKCLVGSIKLLEAINVVQVDDNRITLTKEGSSFKSNLINSTKEEALYFLIKHLFQCFKSYDFIRLIIPKDAISRDSTRNQYYLKLHFIPFKAYPIKNLFVNLKLFNLGEYDEGFLWIDNRFEDLFQTHIVSYYEGFEKKRKVSIQELKSALKLKEGLGKEAEEFVLKYEKSRLHKHTRLEEVRLVSSDFVNAGYDLQSFNSESSVFLDRFIEVKSFRGNPEFYWTKNEIQVSQELADKYYLYLVDRDLYNQTDYHPTIIKNPAFFLFNSDNWSSEVETLKMIYRKN